MKNVGYTKNRLFKILITRQTAENMVRTSLDYHLT